MAHRRPAQFLSEADYQRYAHNLIERILLFADLLRKNRVPVHTAKELDAIAALQHVDISNMRQFYLTLRSTLLVSNRYFPVFDRLFQEFWNNEGDLAQPADGTPEEQDKKQNPPEKQKGGKENPSEQGESSKKEDNSEKEAKLGTAEDSEEEGASSKEITVPTYSLTERLREKDFEDIKPSEFAEFDDLFKKLRIKVKEKRGRRFKTSHRGRTIDLPKSIRHSRQKGGEIVKIFTKEKKPKHSKLVLLADVSASMDVYSTFLIKFIYELQKYVPDTETFVFSTRLKRISDILSHHSIGTALSLLSSQVLFWSGGTDIGGSFLEFNTLYGGKLRKRNRILVILSDGWDTGDIETLKRQMAIFKKGFKKIIWLNPNLKYENFEPLCMGMAASMPYIDYFLPCHNLKTLETFIEIVQKI